MGTNLEALKPVLRTHSSPVIPALTTSEDLETGSEAGAWARSVYPFPTFGVVHCGSQGVDDRGGVMQFPALHVSPEKHDTPHAPQFAVDVVGSTQEPEQKI